MIYRLLADAVLVVHFAVVLFVVGGLVAIIAGNLRGWPWVNAWWFRIGHLMAIAVVVAQAWLGRHCALTTLESWLRQQGGEPGYDKSFIQAWVQRVMYYEAPLWAFAIVYSVFALLVVAAWVRYPPRRGQRAR